MEAGSLGVDREKRLAAKPLEEAFQLSLTLDQAYRGLRWFR
jgi:hypothetical protein